MAEAYIIDAVRTPRSTGKPGKSAYTSLHPQNLAATVLKALKERNNINTAEVDDVIWGTSAQYNKQGGDMGRMARIGCRVRREGQRGDAGPVLRQRVDRHQSRRGGNHVRAWKIW